VIAAAAAAAAGDADFNAHFAAIHDAPAEVLPSRLRQRKPVDYQHLHATTDLGAGHRTLPLAFGFVVSL